MRAGGLFLTVIALLAVGPLALGQTELQCLCDHQAQAFEARNCGLCAEVEKAPPNVPVVFIKDNDPKKPNRWLALPRAHVGQTFQFLSDLSSDSRTVLWREAIARANNDWGNRWGLAVNGSRGRGQCHLHIHIGRLIEAVEWGEFKVVEKPEEIPDPGPLGIWVHPVDGKIHVHIEMAAETVLAR